MSLFANAQTVENIRTQQDGEKINIYYQIANSNKDQLFRVSISCRINNKNKITLKTVNGDVGDNVKGGEKEYKAVWDVLKDVDELTNAEFFVRSELKDDGSTLQAVKTIEGFNPFKYDKERKGQFFIAVQTVGGKVGYMGKWGFAVSAGPDLIDYEFSLLASISKSIIRKQHFQWNIYPIVGIHETFYYDYYDDYYDDYDDEYYIGIAYGCGTDIAIGHLYLNFDFFIDEEAWPHIMTGFGWRF